MSTVLIAGAGHGGLVAGAYLAEAGFDVRLFEKNDRSELGHDWHDTMNNRTFEYAGIKNYKKEDVHKRKDSTFFAPSINTPVSFDIEPSKVDMEIDRKVLYNYLLDRAEKCGVKITFNTPVESPYIKDGKVAGLVVNGEVITADMVIDSAGMYSPVYNKLPKSYSINSGYRHNQVFHTYRAYYNLLQDNKITNPERFNIYFKFANIDGITWFKITEGMADVLVGSIKPITMEEVNIIIEKFREIQPSIGNKLLRGGQIKHIPLKSTCSLIVGDNYAAVGDAVSMPIPLNGSGITNSIFAGKILAETIINIDKSKNDYSINNLWEYQVKYFKEIGHKMISINILKNRLLAYSPKVIDFFFDRGILTANELSAGANGRDVILGKKETLDKLKRGYLKPISLITLKLAVKKTKVAKQLAYNIPEDYDKEKITQWRNKLEKYINS